MNNFEERSCLEIAAQELCAIVNDEKKLVLTQEEVNELRAIQDQLDEFRHHCQNLLAQLLKRHGVNEEIVQLLDFPELFRPFIRRDTDPGIMECDLQQFRMFHAAVRLVTKSADERGQELSDKMELLLTDMASVMWRLLRKNDILPPEPPRSGHLEQTLNETTKAFLEYVREQCREAVLTEITIEEDFTDNDDPDHRAICDVRNYVIVKDLGGMLLHFQKDLGHLIRLNSA
ncbi:hypothetical protein OS493_015111 [Desmophyllum pertusum]|uniref:Uncharacterized protein n=1 Tax=Desmophyllum pertusum TaxID=174260 RepID=A0A9W9ZT76_9CNID|nr:hypothetical protein OS493_015111 [Desmophyllum pertusum]